MNREELLDLIPAYALDALDNDERREVETLLAHDAEAQALLRDYEAVTAVLTMAVPQRPAPAHLKADLQARLASRQAEPLVLHEPEKVEASGTMTPVLRFPTTVLLSSAAAIALVVVGILYVVFGRGTTASPNELLYNEFLEQSGSTSISLIPVEAENATGDLVFAADGSQAVLRIESLPDTTEDESYQLWAITEEEGLQSLGIFHWPTGHGPYFVPIDETIDNLQVVAMTIEPFEGSPLITEPSSGHLFDVLVEF